MVADGVAFFDEPAQETGVFLDLSADHEKRRLYVVLSQGREDSGRGARVRAVVESERDPAPRGTRLAVGRQIRRKIPGYRRGPDLSHIRRWVGRFGKGPGLHGRDGLHAPQLRNPGVVDERAQKKKPTTRASTTAMRRATKRRLRVRLKASERGFGIAFRGLPGARRGSRLPDRNFVLKGRPR